VPDDLIFSFPLEITNGDWKICSYDLNDSQKQKLEASWKELLEERQMALGF